MTSKQWVLGGLSTIFVIGMGLTVLADDTSTAWPESSFNEVWSVVTQRPATLTADIAADLDRYGTPDDPKLPQYSGNIDLFLKLITGKIKQAGITNINVHDDYFDHLEKVVHANGTCFQGTWQITEESQYSGYFSKGSTGLIIGRISAANPDTVRGKSRSFGFAGKIYPTMDPNAKVRTVNFMTLDDVNGTLADHVLDEGFSNEPRLKMNALIQPLNDALEHADLNPAVRHMYPIARAGLPAGVEPTTPKWMRIHVAPGQQLAGVNDADFRDELSPKNYPNGLKFLIQVSDTQKDPLSEDGWHTIGNIQTSAFVVSYGCDRRLRFSHPRFNDPQAPVR